MNEDQQGTVAQKRLVQWLVRGTKPDGTRWKSGHRHDTREAAEAETERWGPEMGEMKIMRITYPKGLERLREQDGNHYETANVARPDNHFGLETTKHRHDTTDTPPHR